MPAKINMVISNGNQMFAQQMRFLSQQPVAPRPIIPTALNAPIISRIHTVKPGCGSCGRK